MLRLFSHNYNGVYVSVGALEFMILMTFAIW